MFGKPAMCMAAKDKVTCSVGGHTGNMWPNLFCVLLQCRDVVIGSAMVKGISGGQAKVRPACCQTAAMCNCHAQHMIVNAKPSTPRASLLACLAAC